MSEEEGDGQGVCYRLEVGIVSPCRVGVYCTPPDVKVWPATPRVEKLCFDV